MRGKLKQSELFCASVGRLYSIFQKPTVFGDRSIITRVG